MAGHRNHGNVNTTRHSSRHVTIFTRTANISEHCKEYVFFTEAPFKVPHTGPLATKISMNALERRRKDGKEEDEDLSRPIWLNLGNPLSAKSLFSGNVTPVEVKRLRRFLPQPNLWLAT